MQNREKRETTADPHELENPGMKEEQLILKRSRDTSLHVLCRFSVKSMKLKKSHSLHEYVLVAGF